METTPDRECLYVIFSRHTGSILDASAFLEVAIERKDAMNERYQSDEYQVREYRR